jgi:hypothetical protein
MSLHRFLSAFGDYLLRVCIGRERPRYDEDRSSDKN